MIMVQCGGKHVMEEAILHGSMGCKFRVVSIDGKHVGPWTPFDKKLAWKRYKEMRRASVPEGTLKVTQEAV